jgi:hypothetical protein
MPACQVFDWTVRQKKHISFLALDKTSKKPILTPSDNFEKNPSTSCTLGLDWISRLDRLGGDQIIMFTKCLFFLSALLFIPSIAWAWGPLTHIYVASELFAYASIIPATIFSLMTRFRQDFLYGNLMADMILGKSYLPEEKSPHSWATGMRFLEQARNDSEKAFAYGYLCHLAADTVAHGIFVEEQQDVSHTWLEMQADAMIHKIYWLQSVSFSRAVQRRNDRFLESSLDSYIFSFKTNKKIYKSLVFLSLLNVCRKVRVNQDYIHELHDHSLARMISLLRDGETSLVLQENPMAIRHP